MPIADRMERLFAFFHGWSYVCEIRGTKYAVLYFAVFFFLRFNCDASN